ncbi:MAK10-like protein [Tanacetum coccineum]
MGEENPIHTLGDYSKPSHDGYRNTIELPIGNNVDPNQHLKDFLKLVDSLDIDGSITTWEDLTTRFLAQFFPLGRTVKLHNDILMFQQHHGESLSEAWTCFKDLLQKVPHHGINLWLENDPRDFAKPVKAIALPQDVPSTSDRHLIELPNASSSSENLVQTLDGSSSRSDTTYPMNKITTLHVEIFSGPADKLSTHPMAYRRKREISVHTEQQSASYDDGEKENKEEEDYPKNIQVNPPTQPDPSVTFITEKVLKFNFYFESLGLVPPSSNTEFICTKGEDGDVMFIEIVLKDDNSRKEEPEAGEQEVEYFDIFPTRSDDVC